MSPAGEKSGPATLDLGDPAYWSAPHAYLGPAREQHPVALTKTGEHVILRYADVESLAGDPRLISDAQPMLTRQGVHEGPLLEWWQRMLTNTNAPEHTRLRALVSRAFTPRSIERMRPRVREITRELLRDCGPGNVDLLQSFAHVLPIRFMCEWLGVPRELEADVGRWSIELGEGLSEALTPEVRSRAEHAVIELERCAAELLSARRAEPRDDLISALVGAADASDMDFDEADLITLVINLLFGGHDTSRSLLSIGTAVLLQHPDQLARLRRDPARMPGAIEEILRCEPIITVLARAPVEDLELGGVALPAHEMLWLSIASANRDPRVFDAPDRFDIDRRGPHSLSFGWGPHHCLGASLARAEAQEAFTSLLACCPTLELAEPVRWVPYAAIRRLESLQVSTRLA